MYIKCNQLRSEQIEAKTILETATAYIKTRATAIERIEADVKLTMEMSGIEKIDDPDLKLSIPKASLKLFVQDEKLIPASYFTTIPATLQLDKRALLADAKIAEEPIAGIILIPSKTSLKYAKPK